MTEAEVKALANSIPEDGSGASLAIRLLVREILDLKAKLAKIQWNCQGQYCVNCWSTIDGGHKENCFIGEAIR